MCANCDGDCSAEVKGHETSLPRIISSLTPPESGTNGDENHDEDDDPTDYYCYYLEDEIPRAPCIS